MKKIITCLFAAFICLGIVAQQADTKSWKKIVKPDKKESKQDKPVDNKDSKESKEQPKKSKYNIGDKGPGGGTVFHVAGNTYIEFSPVLGDRDRDHYEWDEAVKAAKNYKGGGFTNWQLPTKEQLNYMYVNLPRNSEIHAFMKRYWSSSEYSGCECAWSLAFHGLDVGKPEYNHKNDTNSVRAVRAFTP